MNISLTSNLEKFIQEKLDSGLYSSTSEVIRESLRLMLSYDEVQQRRIGQLNQEIDLGLVDIQSGNKVLGSDAYKKIQTKIRHKGSGVS